MTSDGKPNSNRQQIQAALVQLGSQFVINQQQAVKLLQGKITFTDALTPSTTTTTTTTSSSPHEPPAPPPPIEPSSPSNVNQILNLINKANDRELKKIVDVIKPNAKKPNAEPAWSRLQKDLEEFYQKRKKPAKTKNPIFGNNKAFDMKKKLTDMKRVLNELRDEERLENYMKRKGTSVSDISNKDTKKPKKGILHKELKRRKRKTRSRNSWTLARL